MYQKSLNVAKALVSTVIMGGYGLSAFDKWSNLYVGDPTVNTTVINHSVILQS